MASYRKGMELAICLIFTFVALCPISDVVSASYPLNHKGLLPAGRKLKTEKKTLSVSKHLFKKITENQEAMEMEAEREQVHKVQKHVTNPNEFFNTPRKFPSSVMKYNSNSTQLEAKKDSKFKPYYDCPLFNNENSAGQAIIKPDPFDCGCCYMCNWGIHYVQCCTWPLLWNDDIKSCDWYWRVYCYTSDWKK